MIDRRRDCMPAVAAIIEHGTIPSASLTNEDYLLVQSVTFSGTRDTKEYMGGDGTVQAVEERNPKLTITVDAYVSEYSGLPTYEPGQAVTSLANFDSAVLGFDPADGVMIFREPTITRSNAESDKIAFTVAHLPFVA